MERSSPHAPDAARRAAGGAPWRRVALALVALLFLNSALSFSTWWPTPGIVPEARLAPEFVGLWVVLLATVAWRGGLTPAAGAAIAWIYLLLVLGRYVDVTVPSLFGRQVNLFWDLPQIPRALSVAAGARPWWQSAVVVAAAIGLLGSLYVALRRAVHVAGHAAVPYALRARWVWAVTGLAVIVAGANYAGVQATWGFVSKPVLPVALRQARLLAAALLPGGERTVIPESSAVDAAMARGATHALAALRGRDVYVVFLESYGASLYDDPRARQPMRDVRRRFAADLAAGGRHVVSAFVRSPTFGGASDLAHLGLLAGIDLRDPMRHDVLLTTRRPTLLSLFRAAGYQTFGLYPAVSWEWPERAYYAFDIYLEGRTLGYRGPKLGYWWIPDQYALARLEQLHPRDAAAPPRLVFFPTITTHLPFSPVPPFQPDLQRLLGDEPFGRAEADRAMAEMPNWTDMFPDFQRMFDYAFRWLGDWLRRPEPREAIVVLLGDHQPAANVTGEGASWDVPVHIVARDAALLQRFIAQGFQAGLEPSRVPLGEMHELTGMLLRAFGHADGGQGVDRAGGAGVASGGAGAGTTFPGAPAFAAPHGIGR